MRITRILNRAVIGLSAVAATLPLWAVAEGDATLRSRVVGVGKVLTAKTDVRIAKYRAATLPTAHIFIPPPPGESQEKQGLVWLNNQRVMFVGVVRDDPSSRGLYIWDVAARTVQQYSQHTEFCFADDYIFAQQIQTGLNYLTVRPIRYGRLGNEQDDTCDMSTRRGCHGFLNMSCKPRASFGPAPFGKEAVYAIELRNGDGVIVNPVALSRAMDPPQSVEAQRRYFSRPNLLVSKRYPEGRPLPITAVDELSPWSTSYSAYAKRYVFVTERPNDGQVGLITTWPRGRPEPIYLMDIDGNVEKVLVPSRSDWNKIHLAQVATPGIVFWGIGGHANEWGGLFLYTEPDLFALDRGKLEALAVSPDGCKVAYAVFTDFGKTPTNFARIKFIDFCAGRQY